MPARRANARNNPRWSILATRLMYLVAGLTVAVVMLATMLGGGGTLRFTEHPVAQVPVPMLSGSPKEWAGIRAYVDRACRVSLPWQRSHEALCARTLMGTWTP